MPSSREPTFVSQGVVDDLHLVAMELGYLYAIIRKESNLHDRAAKGFGGGLGGAIERRLHMMSEGRPILNRDECHDAQVRLVRSADVIDELLVVVEAHAGSFDLIRFGPFRPQRNDPRMLQKTELVRLRRVAEASRVHMFPTPTRRLARGDILESLSNIAAWQKHVRQIFGGDKEPSGAELAKRNGKAGQLLTRVNEAERRTLDVGERVADEMRSLMLTALAALHLQDIDLEDPGSTISYRNLKRSSQRAILTSLAQQMGPHMDEPDLGRSVVEQELKELDSRVLTEMWNIPPSAERDLG